MKTFLQKKFFSLKVLFLFAKKINMETKEKEILMKVRDLFMTYGIRSMTMDDIAHRLGMSKRTLYEYFKDKADLIRKIVFLEVERIDTNMKEIANKYDNVIEIMAKINEYIIDMHKKTPKNVKFDLQKYYPAILEEVEKYNEQKMFISIKDNLLKGQKQGLIREDLNIDIIAALQVGRSYIIDKIMSMLENIEFKQVLTEIFEYHILAVTTKKGLDIYNQIKNYEK